MWGRNSVKRVLALLIALTAAVFGQAASDNIIVVGNVAQPVQWVHQVDIKTALLKAGPNGTVIIPANYIGTDCAPISSCTPGTTLVIDLRGGLFQTVPAISGGNGVTTVSVTPANGVTGSVANPTTTPAITLTLGAVTPSSIVDTGIAVAPNTSPICPNGTGGAFSITGCAGGGAPAFSAVTTGANATPLSMSGVGTLSPSGTGQIAASQDWYQNGPGVISPVTPTLAFITTTGALTANTYFVKVTYVGLAVTEPSGEAKVSATGCVANACQVTVTMPATCVSGSLPAGVTGCTVWDSITTGTEKQQAASAACVNITTATCVISTLAAGSTLTTPQTGITPVGAQAVTCPDNIIPTNWFQAADGNFYNLGGIDVSALNLPSPPGTFTWCHRFFVNDTNGPPVIANTLVSIHHQAGNLTNTGSTTDDRALGIEMIDTTTATPIFEQSLTQYNERIVTNNSFNCNPINAGTPQGESCGAALRAIINDSRTGNVAGATSFEGVAGVASSSGATAQASGTQASYVGVKGGAFQSTASQNGNSNTYIGGFFGTSAATPNSGNGVGIGVQITSPTAGTRFSGQNIGLRVNDHGTNAFDWDALFISANGTTSGKVMLQGNLWASALTAGNSTLGILGSINPTGGITTSQLPAPGVNSFSLASFGTAGAAAVTYKITCVDSNGNETTSSAAGTINTSNADLTAAHGNTVTAGTFNGTSGVIGCSSFNIYRTASASTCNGGACTNGKLGNVAASFLSSSENFGTAPVFSDTGQVGDGNTAVAQGNTTGGIKAFNYQTNTNCAVNSASPAACGSAAAGAVVIPTTTTTYTVNTTAVTAHSRIQLTWLTFAGDLPSAPTCVAPLLTTDPTISNIVATTSFTVTMTSTTGQTCPMFTIEN